MIYWNNLNKILMWDLFKYDMIECLSISVRHRLIFYDYYYGRKYHFFHIMNILSGKKGDYTQIRPVNPHILTVKM